MEKKIYFLSSIFFIFDFITKLVIKNIFSLGKSITLISNFFNLTYVLNSGAAFSILRGKQIFLVILGIIALIYIFYNLRKDSLNNYKVVYYSLLIGGIIGNIFDRIIYNGVVDFLDFIIFSYDAPIFNFADAFIVISIILILIENFRKEIYGNRSS